MEFGRDVPLNLRKPYLMEKKVERYVIRIVEYVVSIVWVFIRQIKEKAVGDKREFPGAHDEPAFNNVRLPEEAAAMEEVSSARGGGFRTEKA
ncbi:hypothetical protein ColTof4_09947 [Colletotrichum tofieldiae]|nr:hypothetical protein ColTof4_09947 [Colletotrichum tofieldiae]